MRTRRAILLLLLVPMMLLANPAAAQILKGPAGLAGNDGADADTELVCSPNCSLSYDLVVTGTLEADAASVVGGVSTGSEHVLGTLDAGGPVDLGDTEVSDLQVVAVHHWPECPPEYEYNAGVCERDLGNGVVDEMVPVGDFWIDRYEISTWSDPNCSGTQYGVGVDNYPNTSPEFPDNGNWDNGAEVFACSIAQDDQAQDVAPSAWLTWYQSLQVCALAGKSLCTNAQWQAAAAGTPDDATCNISSGSVAAVGLNGGCGSVWGAMDMVGNLWEWVAPIQGHAGFNGDDNGMTSEYGTDGYWAGGPAPGSHPAFGADGSWRPFSDSMPGYGDGLNDDFGPAGVRRGGDFNDGTLAGVFTLDLQDGPARSHSWAGARCCIGR